MKRALLLAAASFLITRGVLAETEAPFEFCKSGDYAHHVRMYQGCIAAKAKELELSGDSAESVATAAIGACRDWRYAIARYIDVCLNSGAGVGERALQKTSDVFRDWAIQSAVQARADRLSGKSK